MQTFLAEDEREETIIERRERERVENGKVDNDEHIPLIPDVKKDVRKTIHEIQVWKLDSPNEGFRGCVPPHAGISTIATLFGNGVYDFHAVTQDGKVLRRNTRVSVSLQSPKNPTEQPPAANRPPDFNLLEWQAKQHERDTQRVQDFGQMAITTSRQSSEQQFNALAQQLQAAQERDRAFFAGMLQNQQQFFQAMMSFSSQQHTQSMERQREDYNRTLQIVQASNERIAQANDPRTFLGLLHEGMNLALGAGGDEEEEIPEAQPQSAPGWVQAITAGAGAVKEIVDLSKLKAQIAVPAAPAATNAPAEAPSRKLPNRRKDKLPLNREELKEIIRTKKLLENNGLDFVATVRKATQVLTGGPAIDSGQPENGNEPDSDASASDIETGTPETDMGDSTP